MRFEQKRDALDGRGVGPFSALRESLLDERPKIGEQPDLAARFTFAAKIIPQLQAIGRLREHSSEREFSHTARAREEHRMWYALGGQHAAKRGDDARVTEKI